MQKRFLYLVNFVLISFCLFGQEDEAFYQKRLSGNKKDTAWSIQDSCYHPEAFNNTWDIKFGYRFSYKYYHIGEIGIKKTRLLGYKAHSRDFTGTCGSSFTAEVLVKNKTLILGPKVGFEMEWLFIGAKLSAIYYTSTFKKGDLKLRGEAGITLAGYINLFYGYSVNLIDEKVLPQRHSVSIFFNVPFRAYYNRRHIKDGLYGKVKLEP